MSDSTNLLVPRGFRAAGVKAGIKPSGGSDLAVFVADGPCAAAGTFTTNRICAAPVKWCRELLPREDTIAVVVNAGNANAATGDEGLANARRTAERAAGLLGCRPEQILVASTGIIGHQLPMPKIEAGLGDAVAAMSREPSGFLDAARAIITTDTHPKIVSERRNLSGKDVTLLGIAKGAAMIGPRMATMLAFLLTDAPVRAYDLRALLADAVDSSFNCLSVEGHASTNDTVLLISSTAATEETLRGEDARSFAVMVRAACESLARQIADDGEGSTHSITIDVEGCRTTEDARAIARTVAESPLVKTAIHGADPNWGRIVSAAGYAGVAFQEEEVSLWINDVPVYRRGTPLPFDEAALSGSLRGRRQVDLRLVVGSGESAARFWTCDLTADYVRLNADYTT
jgi:glutamate N-acetyltransferase / amino-acid N-acetyltransferase